MLSGQGEVWRTAPDNEDKRQMTKNQGLLPSIPALQRQEVLVYNELQARQNTLSKQNKTKQQAKWQIKYPNGKRKEDENEKDLERRLAGNMQ